MLSVSQLIAPSKELSPKILTAETEHYLSYLLWQERIRFLIVAPRGFEPLHSEPKSDVLPLYYRTLIITLNDRPILL